MWTSYLYRAGHYPGLAGASMYCLVIFFTWEPCPLANQGCEASALSTVSQCYNFRNSGPVTWCHGQGVGDELIFGWWAHLLIAYHLWPLQLPWLQGQEASGCEEMAVPGSLAGSQPVIWVNLCRLRLIFLDSFIWRGNCLVTQEIMFFNW